MFILYIFVLFISAGVIRGLKNANLDKEKLQAEQAYYDAMNQYIATRLGRPLERMSVS